MVVSVLLDSSLAITSRLLDKTSVHITTLGVVNLPGRVLLDIKLVKSCVLIEVHARHLGIKHPKQQTSNKGQLLAITCHNLGKLP